MSDIKKGIIYLVRYKYFRIHFPHTNIFKFLIHDIIDKQIEEKSQKTRLKK